MALIKCPECGNEFSSFAERCPKCGYPTAKIVGKTKNTDEVKEEREITSSSNRSSHKKIISIISVCAVVLIAVILWFVFAKSDNTAESSEGNIITKVVDKVAPPLSTPDLQLAEVQGNVKQVKTKSYISDSEFKSKQLNEEVHNSGGKNWETYCFDKNGYFTQYKDFHLTCSEKGKISSVQMDAYVDIDPQHMGIYDWKIIDATLKRDAKGYIVSEKYVIDGEEMGTNYTNTEANGKLKTRKYQTFGPADTESGSITYDANGNVIKHINNNGNGIITTTYQYTRYDNHNNWTQRRVIEDNKSDYDGQSGTRFYIEERTIVYY
jgi:ribosomal protein L37E